MKQFTKEQQAAIELKRSSVGLAAGAGSGKTTVLTSRMLRDLDIRKGPNGILQMVAITFTDRASREMRERLREKCYEEQRCASPETLVAWQQVINLVDQARISTIHSFCQGMLRSYALEFGLDPQFQILEQSIAQNLLRQTLNEEFIHLLEARDADLMELLVMYELNKTRSILESFVEQRFRLDLACWLDITEEIFSAQLKQRYFNEYLPEMLSELHSCDTAKNILNIYDTYQTNNSLMKERGNVLREAVSQFENYQVTNTEHLLGLIELSKSACTHAKTKNAWNNTTVQEKLSEYFKSFKKRLDDLKKLVDVKQSHFDDSAHYGIVAARVALKITRKFQAAKKAQSALDFDDLLIMARDFLKDHPDVREKISSEIDLLLVDEFQDTDPIQLEIIRYLCGEDLHQGKLFFVGDIKQSIYRFRRADPELFRELRQEVPGKGQLSLTMNFRSQPAILDFVNIVFATGMGEDYEPLKATQEQLSPLPSVEFLFPRVTLASQIQTGPLIEAEAEWIARRIKVLLDDPVPRVRDKNSLTGKLELRRAEPGDIVLLFSSLTKIQQYEEQLLKHEIDYYLVGGHAFFTQQEIYDITNLCLAVDDIQNKISLLGVLRSPMFNLSDETIFLLTTGRRDIWQSMMADIFPNISESQIERIRHARNVIMELRAHKDHLSIADLLKLAMEKTGYDASLLLEHLGSRKLANLQKLIEQGRIFSNQGLGLNEFAAHLKHSLYSEVKEEFAATSPEVGNTVRLMTVHQSKGLEFPIVFVTNCNRKLLGNTQNAVLNQNYGALVSIPDELDEKAKNPGLAMFRHDEKKAEIEQSLRLFYVAMTRARDHLILSGGMSDTKPALSESWLGLLDRTFNLQTGLLKNDPLLGTMTQGVSSREKIPLIKVHLTKPEIELRKGSKKESSKKPSVIDYQEKILHSEPQSFGPLSREIGITPARNLVMSVSLIESLVTLETSKFITQRKYKAAEIVELEDKLDAHDKTELGTLIHGVLEHFPFELKDSGQLSSRILRTARLMRMDHKEELLFTAMEKIRHFVNSSFRVDLIKMNHQRELEFRLPWKIDINEHSLIITGTIDLLSFNENGEYWISDYKTGVLPDDPLSVNSHYALQLGIYAEVLNRNFGKYPDKIFLVEMSNRFKLHDMTSLRISEELLNKLINQAVRRHLLLQGK